jgi:hypothetical protein
LFIITGGNDEYLSGMTFEEMTGGEAFSAPDDDRRYQF